MRRRVALFSMRRPERRRVPLRAARPAVQRDASPRDRPPAAAAAQQRTGPRRSRATGARRRGRLADPRGPVGGGYIGMARTRSSLHPLGGVWRNAVGAIRALIYPGRRIQLRPSADCQSRVQPAPVQNSAGRGPAECVERPPALPRPDYPPQWLVPRSPKLGFRRHGAKAAITGGIASWIVDREPRAREQLAWASIPGPSCGAGISRDARATGDVDVHHVGRVPRAASLVPLLLLGIPHVCFTEQGALSRRLHRRTPPILLSHPGQRAPCFGLPVFQPA